MSDTTKITGTVTVTATWVDILHALCDTLCLVGVVPSEVTDEQLEFLQTMVAKARQRLREQSGG